MNLYQSLCYAFSSRERPDHFTDYEHCEECAEHDATLCSKDNDSISFEDVRNIASTPISFISTEGFMYYMPGLARLAGGTGDNYYLDTFLIHLENEEIINAMTDSEKEALSNYLKYLQSEISQNIEDNLDSEDLKKLIMLLSNNRDLKP